MLCDFNRLLNTIAPFVKYSTGTCWSQNCRNVLCNFKFTEFIRIRYMSDSVLAATKQLYEQFRPSVRLSAWHIFKYVLPIVSSWNFTSYCHWCPCKWLWSVKGQGHRSKKKCTKLGLPDLGSICKSPDAHETMHKDWHTTCPNRQISK